MLRGKIAHFRLTCGAQKRRCLSSLLCPSQGLRDVGKKKGTRSAKLDMLLKMVVLSLLFLLLAVNTASLAKIAGFAAVGGSGYINMRNIMEELASRGHEVH